ARRQTCHSDPGEGRWDGDAGKHGHGPTYRRDWRTCLDWPRASRSCQVGRRRGVEDRSADHASISAAWAPRVCDGFGPRSLHARKGKLFGDLVEVRAKTRDYIKQLMPDLETLNRLIETPAAVNGTVSMDDIRVLPLLRSAAVVKGLSFPEKVRAYFET